MADYRLDQDRFLDSLRDLADFREAAAREQLAEFKSRLDKAVKSLSTGRYRIFDTEREARERIIAALKETNALPADYIYRDSRSTSFLTVMISLRLTTCPGGLPSNFSSTTLA
jgi:hypothetical protein